MLDIAPTTPIGIVQNSMVATTSAVASDVLEIRPAGASFRFDHNASLGWTPMNRSGARLETIG
jgi:hypothetical protein